MLSEAHRWHLATRPLGIWLGSRDPAHLRRWRAALRAGYLAGPRCEGMTRLGERCQRLPLHGADKCCLHLRGAERDRVDQARLARQHRLALTGSAGERQRALRQIANIERGMLYRAWRKDPTIEARTLILTDGDEACVREYLLLQHGFDLDRPDPVTRELLTPAARDAARWAGQRGVTELVDAQGVRRRIEELLRRERRFWAGK
jgi:hypothetical protein